MTRSEGRRPQSGFHRAKNLSRNQAEPLPRPSGNEAANSFGIGSKNAGYFFASESFIRRQVAPAEKISEKRRLQCFNNLVMLNNASLMYRLENGRSPKSLSELITDRFVDPCPYQ